jgi:hypothetical protein
MISSREHKKKQIKEKTNAEKHSKENQLIEIERRKSWQNSM